MLTSNYINTFQNFQRYRRLRRRRVKLYYFRLLKASLLIATIPIIMLIVMVIYDWLSPLQSLFAGSAALLGAMLLARPYLSDLLTLTHYVEQLALDRHAKTPSLGFLSNVGVLSHAVSNLHDSWATRKMELESAIAESKILFDTLPDMMLMLNDKLEVVRANNAAFIRLGQRLIGKNISKSIPDDFLTDSLNTVLKDNESQDIDIPIATKQGDKDFRVRIERFPVKSRGGIALVLVMIDITESKKARQMIKDFVANASHEVRTPLASLIGFIETIREMEDDDKEARDKFLSIMAEQAEHMNKLISELLSLSKIEMNEHTLPTERITVKEFVNNAIRRIGWMADERNMRIDLKIGKKLPEIIGDADELSQVLVNLISNAIKYGKENTDIKVTIDQTDTIPTIAGRLKGKSRAVVFSVQDEGEGISAEDLPRITERFYRVDKVRSRKAGGTGLGLAIVKHILNRHRADMVIESALGKGSTFSVYLPIADEVETPSN